MRCLCHFKHIYSLLKKVTAYFQCKSLLFQVIGTNPFSFEVESEKEAVKES